MIHGDSKLTENRICEIIMSTILKNNLQIHVHETWVSKSDCGHSLILIYLNISVFSIYILSVAGRN